MQIDRQKTINLVNEEHLHAQKHTHCINVYIVADMSLGVHKHTIDELTESNIGIDGYIFR